WSRCSCSAATSRARRPRRPGAAPGTRIASGTSGSERSTSACARRGRYRSLPSSRAGPGCDPGAELHEVQRGAAERQLDPARPAEVPEQRILGVAADSAVQVLGGVRDAEAGLGGPELRGVERLVGLETGTQAPCRLPGRERDRLGVDVGIGGALRDRLEGRDLLAELLALGDVRRGQAQRLGAYAGL